MTTAICPGCQHRPGAVIDPDCPICAGTGRVTLGARALALYPPEVVSDAIRLVLERAATDALHNPERARVAPRVLPETVARLTRLGLIDL